MNLEEQKLYFLEQRALYNKNSSNEMEMAALMLFLNKTCFNGLYRENRQGIFNVSFANLKRPSICSPELIRKDSELLQGVTLMCGDYRQTESFAEKGCFFYFDPPYKPISKTSSFTSYTKQDFGDDEQIGLAQFCSTIRQKGACWMQSNSDVKNYDPDNNFFEDLYSDCSISKVSVVRDMGSSGKKNKRIDHNELLTCKCDR